jgi:hypothetical protein
LDNQRLPVRVIAAGLPLVLIALVFGAIGYATTKPSASPIPPLPAATPVESGVQGEVTSVSADSVTITKESGESQTYTLSPGVRVEVLQPIDVAAIRVGDWLNGGAIPHPDTVLALESLILVSQPVAP